jgi:hypothetical protein
MKQDNLQFQYKKRNAKSLYRILYYVRNNANDNRYKPSIYHKLRIIMALLCSYASTDSSDESLNFELDRKQLDKGVNNFDLQFKSSSRSRRYAFKGVLIALQSMVTAPRITVMLTQSTEIGFFDGFNHR